MNLQREGHMPDSPQDQNTLGRKPRGFLITKEGADAADAWARAYFHSALGPVKGEEYYRNLSALPILIAYKALLHSSGWH